MKRKTIALLLCALLVLAAIPLSGLAAGGLTAGLTASVEKVPAGETFTVSIVVDGAQNAADVLLTYDNDLVTYVSATEAPRYSADGKILFLDVDTAQSGTINTFTFKAKEGVTAVSKAVFTIEHAKFAERLEAMTEDAKDAVLSPASVSVNILPKYTVAFMDGSSTLKSETVVWGQPATAPSDPTKTGYTFKGWSDGTSTFSADDINKEPVTAEVTYRAVFELSYTVTQNKDYVGGYVRVLITDAALDGYTFDGSTMYRLTDNTYAILYPLAQGSELPAEEVIRAKIAAAAATDAAYDLSAQYGTGDVNYNANNTTNIIDIADAEAAFNCENVQWAVADYMDVYLRSDMNHDGVVNSDDVTAILAIIEASYNQP